MTLQRRQFEDLPGIDRGPVSLPEQPDGPDAPEWLNNRTHASTFDHAFSELRRQRLLSQLGEPAWQNRSASIGTSHAGPEESPLPSHISYVYRGMHTDEFNQARERGFIQSDERGVIIPGWEGTNAATEPASAHSYMPRRPGGGHIVKIATHPDDQWFQSNMDGYARSRMQIPWHRVVAHTEHFVHQGAEDAPETVRDVVKRHEKLT